MAASVSGRVAESAGAAVPEEQPGGRAERAWECICRGSNTRRIGGALEPPLTGAALSKSAVSRLVLRLQESYRSWQHRDLAQERMTKGSESADGWQLLLDDLGGAGDGPSPAADQRRRRGVGGGVGSAVARLIRANLVLTPTAVPEPSALELLGLGLLGIALL